MTAVAGIVKDGQVYIGADSAGTDAHWGQQVRADSKVFTRGEYLIGFTSSFRMGQLLRYRVDLPEPYEWEHDMHAFMATRFVDAVRQAFKDYGYAEKDKDRETGGTFLVGFRGAIYKIESDYQVAQSADAFDACGSGDSIVLGALYATERTSLDPDARLALALEAAARYNAAVRPPFVVARA